MSGSRRHHWPLCFPVNVTPGVSAMIGVLIYASAVSSVGSEERLSTPLDAHGVEPRIAADVFRGTTRSSEFRRNPPSPSPAAEEAQKPAGGEPSDLPPTITRVPAANDRIRVSIASREASADGASATAHVDESNGTSSSTPAALACQDLVETTVTANPPAPILAPGTTFSVTDTAQNLGGVTSEPSTTHYYLSLGPVKRVGDTLLTGRRAVPALLAGSSHSGTITVGIPENTPLNTYFVLACADDLSTLLVGDERNCIASASAIVTVTRPDLVEKAVSDPPVTAARGSNFPITDVVQNLGTVASGPSKTRYYLSLDMVTRGGDTLLTGSRAVPGLAAGGSQSGTVNVAIPSATPPNTYFLLACADSTNVVVETDEMNNCTPSGTTVTVTRDGARSSRPSHPLVRGAPRPRPATDLTRGSSDRLIGDVW